MNRIANLPADRGAATHRPSPLRAAARVLPPALLLSLLSLLPAAACRHDVGADRSTPANPTEPAMTSPADHVPDPSEARSGRPDPAPAPGARAVATLGAGCFWCIEAVLERLDGVVEVTSGYMGGEVDAPTYSAVCTGRTGHAEVVQVTFDPAVLSFDALLDWFFAAHDPTTPNRQGNDVGTQYRSAIFCHDEAQRRAAEAAKARAQAHYRDPIVTEIRAASRFWPAEDYHQDYFAKNPGDRYCNAFIPPKLRKLGLDGDK